MVAKELGQTAVAPLKGAVLSSMIVTVGHAFAFFAITTSFLGVTLGLFDFLADSLKIPKKGVRKLFLAFLTFIPPSLISLINPTAFITALVFAGGIGCALLLGLLPTIMVWMARYRHEGHDGPVQLFGGKWTLSALLVFVLFELLLEFGMK